MVIEPATAALVASRASFFFEALLAYVPERRRVPDVAFAVAGADMRGNAAGRRGGSVYLSAPPRTARSSGSPCATRRRSPARPSTDEGRVPDAALACEARDPGGASAGAEPAAAAAGGGGAPASLLRRDDRRRHGGAGGEPRAGSRSPPSWPAPPPRRRSRRRWWTSTGASPRPRTASRAASSPRRFPRRAIPRREPPRRRTRRRRRARARRRAGGFLEGGSSCSTGSSPGGGSEHLRGEDRVRGSRARFLGRLRRRFSKRGAKRGAKRLRRRRRRRHRAGDVSGAHRDARARARAGGGRRRQPDRCARRQGLRRVQGPHVQLRRRRVRRVPPGGDCRGGDELLAKPGWWRSAEEAQRVFACPTKSACLPGNATGDAACAEGHEGPVRGVRIRVPAVGARVRTVRRRSHLRAAHLRDRRLLGVSVVHLPRAPRGPSGDAPAAELACEDARGDAPVKEPPVKESPVASDGAEDRAMALFSSWCSSRSASGS